MVIATGFFDGVHLGHRLTLDRLVQVARDSADQSMVVTFWPHPRNVLQKDASSLRLLTSLREKKKLLAEAGVDRVEVVEFTREFSALTAEQYLRQYVVERFGGRAIVLGYDNKFGSDCADTESVAAVARRIGLEVYISSEVFAPESPDAASGKQTETDGGKQTAVSGDKQTSGDRPGQTEADGDKQTSGDRPWQTEADGDKQTAATPVAISSTRIRKAVASGDIGAARGMLGYDYSLHGVVVEGKRLGRRLGFPTANMQLYEPLKLVPGNGAYLVRVNVLHREFYGMCNVGTRPTIGLNNARTIETNIFDFDEDIYGLDIRVSFLKKIRDEIRFDSIDALKLQLVKDREFCKELI